MNHDFKRLEEQLLDDMERIAPYYVQEYLDGLKEEDEQRGRSKGAGPGQRWKRFRNLLLLAAVIGTLLVTCGFAAAIDGTLDLF